MGKKTFFIVLISIFMLLFSASQAQTLYNGVGHIPTQYQETWNVAGLLKDMSTTAPKLLIEISPGFASPQMVDALDQARTYVHQTGGIAIIHFKAGTYNFSSSIHLTANDSNIVFQGAGANQTTLVFQNMKDAHGFSFTGGTSAWHDLDQNIAKSSSTLHAPSGELSNLSDGDWVQFVKHYYDYHDPNAPIKKDIVGQVTKVTAISTDATGDLIEISDEANKDYTDSDNTNYSLKVRKITPVKNIGIENLKITRSPFEQATNGHPYNIYLSAAVNCWIRGVESTNASANHIQLNRSSHIEVSGNYIHLAAHYGDGGWGYGVVTGASTTNSLIENNIFKKLRHALIAASGSNCDVWTFNYSREQHSTKYGVTYDDRDLDLHAKYPFGHLFEENIVERIAARDYHGENGPFNLFLRNMTTASPTARLETMASWSCLGNNFLNGNGNVEPLLFNPDDPPVTDIYGRIWDYSTSMTHFGAHWAGSYQAYELDDVSYYYSSRPDFLSSNYTWPAIWPKTTTSGELTNSIPAKDRYQTTNKTSNLHPTPHPIGPLAVNITGPILLQTSQQGTFTAEPTEGHPPYTNYQWWERNDEGGIIPLGTITPDALPGGEWFAMDQFDGQSSIQLLRNNDFSLKVKVTDSAGDVAYAIHSVDVGGLGKQVSSNDGTDLPTVYSLQGNYPNPFNPTTVIRYQLPVASTVSIALYDVRGRLIKQLVDQTQAGGYYNILWDGRTHDGNRASSGTYLYRISAKSLNDDREFHQVGKMLLLR